MLCFIKSHWLFYQTFSSADDSITHQKVAIKKLLTPFESNSSAHRVYRELSLMKHCHHPNVSLVYFLPVPYTLYCTLQICMLLYLYMYTYTYIYFCRILILFMVWFYGKFNERSIFNELYE